MATLLNVLILIFMTTPATFSISSPAFVSNGLIPAKYSCEGENINPELVLINIPDATQSFVIIMEDIDAMGGTFDHWIVWDIPPTDIINENSTQGIHGKNGTGKSQYYGPCPPKGSHRYVFRVYSLDSFLELEIGSTRQEVEKAMGHHIIARAEIMGVYKK